MQPYFDPESGTGHISWNGGGTGWIYGKRYRIKIRTVEGEEEYPADNLEETLLRILQEYKEKHVPIQDIQIGRGTLEEHFIELAKEGV